MSKKINQRKINFLLNLSKELRKRILKTSHSARIPHIGSCLSCLELLIHIYWEELSIDVNNPTDPERDRFILSKGHGAPALFQVLAERGFYSLLKLDDFGKAGSVFHEHPPKPGYIPGIEAATGSLGHGFPMAIGMCLSGKIKNRQYNTIALLSDGECNEGSIWEGAMLASGLNLTRLTAIVDFNKWQATGRSEEIMSLNPLKEKWASFGWHVQEINGHDYMEIENAFKNAREMNKPSAIIAHTIKGKGISFMEDDNNWHYKIPSEIELERALEELI
tara:strand:- start:1664 stop:2494 length:831 start_codon:yes stop_codon:yes gene_type:complete